MADRKFSQLDAAQPLAGGDLLAFSQDVAGTLASRKVMLSDLVAYLRGLGGHVTKTTHATNASLALSDGDWVEMDAAAANTLTVPPNSSEAFEVGAVCNIHQRGAGQTTIVAGSGVTIRTPSTLKLRGQYSTAVLVKRATDEWVLAGDLEPLA